MSVSVPYPAQVEFHGERHITRWRPLVQWLLAIPQLAIASALRSLREVLTLISLFTVLFTERIPKPLFDMIATTYRYEWRSMSYACSSTRTTRRSTSSPPLPTTASKRTRH